MYSSPGTIHNEQLRKILLGVSWTKSSEEQRKIEILEKALYLCIDSTTANNRMRNDLAFLKANGVKDVPTEEQITVRGGKHHQRYTHRGWDFVYSTNDQGKWLNRKNLLLNSVGKVFNLNNTRVLNSLSALFYYIHVLGDHIGDSKDTYLDRIKISGDLYNPTVLSEMENHCKLLFSDQQGSNDYKLLFKYFEGNKTSKSFTFGTTITDEEYNQLQYFANNTIDLFNNPRNGIVKHGKGKRGREKRFI